MKENLKNKKGITLIALVITIIVLLILAIVTIRIVINQNIINHANNAVTAYNEAQINESEQLTWVEGLMQNKGGNTGSNSETSSQSTDKSDLTTITGEEIAELKSKSAESISDNLITYFIASKTGEKTDNDAIMAVFDKNLNIISIQTPFVDGTRYMIFFQEGLQPGAEINQWYKVTNDEGEAYNGKCPISKSDYIVYCESYLDKIIASFN